MLEEVTNIDKLRSIALNQYGYVTTAQAADVGVTRPALAMLKKRQRIERIAHGIYRIPQVPSTEYDKFMLAVLWTSAEEAVLSHDTALDIYDICDINPTTIHITISKGRRITRQGSEGYTLHFEDMLPEDITWWEGIPIVCARKAIEQCIDAGIPTYLLNQAIENALARGLILKNEAEILTELIFARNKGV